MKRALFITILSLCLPTSRAMADGVIIPIPPPHPIIPKIQPLPIKYHKVDVVISNQIARTKVDQVFLNPNPVDLEGTYVFPLPQGAAISDFSMYVDGKRLSAEILDKEKARELYESIVRQTKDPALLEYIGQGAFRARIFPIPANGEKRIEIEYSEVLRYDSGTIGYLYPLNTEKFSPTLIKEVSVKVDISSSIPIKAIYSPSHPVKVERKGDMGAYVSYEAYDVKPDRDFVLYWTVSEEDIGVSLVAYRSEDKDGYFALMIAPKIEVSGTDLLPKDLVFVLDISGSMAGEKLEQAKGALRFVLNNLSPQDRFNIVPFSTEVYSFEKGMVPASPEMLTAARKYVDNLKVLGGTNINGALLRSIEILRASSPRFPIIIFLTDGLPTIGETNVDSILANVQKENRDVRARIFAFGVGFDVNARFLDRVAEENGGAAFYVKPSEDIEVAVSSLYMKISSPVLSEPRILIQGIDTYDLYPKSIQDLFVGSQIVLFGRYKGFGDADVVLTGKVGEKERSFGYKVSFPRDETRNDLIPKLWATRKIGYLLLQIAINGPNNEIIDEIVALSKEFGIITPYTSFLIMEDQPPVAEPPVPPRPPQVTFESKALNALRAESGEKAVYTYSDITKIKESTVVGSPTTSSVKYLGGKTFYLSGGFWMDGEISGNEPVIRIVLGSDEYFNYVKTIPDLAKFFSVGKNVMVKYKGVVYQVVEDRSASQGNGNEAGTETTEGGKKGTGSRTAVSIYPNPVVRGGEVRIKVEAEPGSDVSIKIFSVSGSLIRKEGKKVGSTGTSTFLWNPDAKGVYISRIEVRDPAGRVQRKTERIVVR
jgi:Ca-activated chloride channel family protein